MKIERFGVLSDIHIPFHDERALELSLNIFQELNLDIIILLGDVVDFYNVNMHQKNKHPGVLATIEDEINAGLEFRYRIETLFPKAQKIWHEGNHLYRLERYVIDKAPGLFNYLRAKEMLGITENNDWEFIPYNEKRWFKNCNLFMQHSPLVIAKI